MATSHLDTHTPTPTTPFTPLIEIIHDRRLLVKLSRQVGTHARDSANRLPVALGSCILDTTQADQVRPLLCLGRESCSRSNPPPDAVGNSSLDIGRHVGGPT